jgi:hypothetical protein
MFSDDPVLKSGARKLEAIVRTLSINLIKDNYEDTNP